MDKNPKNEQLIMSCEAPNKNKNHRTDDRHICFCTALKLNNNFRKNSKNMQSRVSIDKSTIKPLDEAFKKKR